MENTAVSFEVSAGQVRTVGLASFVRTQWLGVLGMGIVIVALLSAAAAPLLALHDPYLYDPYNTLAAPSVSHPFGTDQNGRDLFSRIVYGARGTAAIAFGSVTVGTLLALCIGSIGGYLGGWVDLVLQRLVDAFMAFPWLILILVIVAITGPGLWQTILAIGILQTFQASRIVRSAVISVKSEVYVDGARVIGCTTARILVRHIMPNIFAPVMVIATVGLGSAVLTEASLSFLGFGVPPPTPTWGGMLSVGGRSFFNTAPWLSIFPGLAITLLVFGFSVAGDALRDIWDPRLRGS